MHNVVEYSALTRPTASSAENLLNNLIYSCVLTDLDLKGSEAGGKCVLVEIHCFSRASHVSLTLTCPYLSDQNGEGCI